MWLFTRALMTNSAPHSGVQALHRLRCLLSTPKKVFKKSLGHCWPHSEYISCQLLPPPPCTYTDTQRHVHTHATMQHTHTEIHTSPCQTLATFSLHYRKVSISPDSPIRDSFSNLANKPSHTTPGWSSLTEGAQVENCSFLS